MLRSPLALTGAILFCLPTSHAQGLRWGEVKPATSPPGRNHHAMAYDASRQNVVLFGGERGSYLADTWLWNGKNWVQAKTATSPQAQYGHAMVYDAARRQVVLFGIGGTWLWNGITWTQAKPVLSPTKRVYHAMAYDAARQQVVLFGGLRGFSSTWLWNGTTWTKAKPTTSPSPRYYHSMAYDSVRKQVVLFGGSNGRRLGDTWLWDGKTWIQAKPKTSPAARYGHAMSYDTVHQQVVLFAGYAGRYVNDTWLWSGRLWIRAKPPISPSARYHHVMTYDTVRQQVVLFAGYHYLSDTWLWGQLAAASVTSYGRPCGTFPGVALTAVKGGLPALGEKLTFNIYGLPRTSTGGLLTLGLSRRSLGALKLPFDLSPLGMKGCYLYNSYDFQFRFRTIASGLGSFVLPIPHQLALAGNKLYAQAFGADRAATKLGLVSSNGLELTFGYR